MIAVNDKPKKNGFVFVGYEDEIAQKPFVSVRIMGKTVAVFSNASGAFFSREMTCKHQGADLTAGLFRGSSVTCPRHGWQYDLRTGECLNRESPPLREHEVAVEDGAVFVSLFPRS
jgi:nitrite reductase/ring-hydroxylating ferredoxin subunit